MIINKLIGWQNQELLAGQPDKKCKVPTHQLMFKHCCASNGKSDSQLENALARAWIRRFANTHQYLEHYLAISRLCWKESLVV